MEFCKIYFLTKFDPESIRMNLHTSSAPFSNGTSVSNLLIMSNLLFFGFYWLRYAKPLCSFFWIRFYVSSSKLLQEKLGQITSVITSTLKIIAVSVKNVENIPNISRFIYRLPLSYVRTTCPAVSIRVSKWSFELSKICENSIL